MIFEKQNLINAFVHGIKQMVISIGACTTSKTDKKTCTSTSQEKGKFGAVYKDENRMQITS